MSVITTNEDMNANPDAPDLTNLMPLYQHAKRPEWGVGIIAWEHDDRRGYQFEDGQLRIIKQGYYNFLQTAPEPGGDTRKKLSALCRRSGFSPASNRSAPPAFSDQVILFRSQYPMAFADETWLKNMRGQSAGRRIKRHRDAAITHAQELFSCEALDQIIAEQRFSEVMQRMVEVFEETDVVSKTHMQPMYDVAVLDHRDLALAVRDLLYGEGEVSARFDALCNVLVTRRNRPSWQLASALAALVHPTEHVCVRPSAFATQAEVLDPAVRAERRPNGRSYVRLVTLAKTVSSNLEILGMPPCDLFDVYDFMWATLRPAARQQLGKVPVVAAADKPTAPDDDEGGAKSASKTKDDMAAAA